MDWLNANPCENGNNMASILHSPSRHVGVQSQLPDEYRQILIGNDLRFRVSDNLRHFRFSLHADDVALMFDGFDHDGSVIELTSDDSVSIFLSGVVVDDMDGVISDVTLLVDVMRVVFLIRHHRRYVEAHLQNLVFPVIRVFPVSASGGRVESVQISVV